MKSNLLRVLALLLSLAMLLSLAACKPNKKNKKPNKTNTLNQYRFSNYSRKQIFIIKKSAKPQILEILDKLSINESHLFPEIADVTNYIKSKY